MLARRSLLLAAPALAAIPIGDRALAQSWPSRPISIVVPFPPGGSNDLLARPLAAKLQQALGGHPVVVENRGGAGGTVGAAQVARSAPDGHTLMWGHVGTLAVNPFIYPNIPYDVLRDFAPVALVATLPGVLAIHPSVPARTTAEFIALAKARPGTLNFASSGNGGLPHLSGELLNAAAGINTIHVPYRGSAPAFTDVIAGQCQFMFDALAIAQPHIAAGRVRALGVTGPRPMPSLPGVPTVAATVPGYEVVNWYGMTLRAGTPAPIVTRLQAEIDAALKVPEVAERSAALGLDLVGSTPDEFATFQRAEIAKWGEVVRRGNIKPD